MYQMKLNMTTMKNYMETNNKVKQSKDFNN